MTDTELGLCQCCNKQPGVGVASIPGVAMSILWCKDCLVAQVVPYWVAVANTASIGGWDDAAEWWKLTVTDTLAYFDKTMDQFLADVAEDIARMDTEVAKLQEEEAKKEPSFTCPKCGMVSYNPTDIANGYCGNCNDWTGEDW